ncbi:hypothetical protein [Algoriphagus pacificus]|uniref:TonB protein C-terminal n=1 Tax=Algoriphagus pacificus TaxID=2811234 RepID=A0ABS3CDI0_9BACT|nr:hypothetical protein [Algoriphagus pacificus]MBN7815168.1 hypothetical protein [Algoriphagus pacificus]
MKIFFLFAFLSISISIHAQSDKVYNYLSSDLIYKPEPSEEFTSWLKENNEKLGKKAPYNSKKDTKVTLVFIVDENGIIQNPKIWRGIGQGYDEYAYNLIKKNPNPWTPAKTENGNVKTEVFYQLDFMKNNNTIRSESNELLEK